MRMGTGKKIKRKQRYAEIKHKYIHIYEILENGKLVEKYNQTKGD